MKTDELLVVGLAGLALWFVFQARAVAAPRAGATRGAREVENGALPGQPGWGWQYFDDGVAIGPDGVYYQYGREIWRPS